MPRRPADPVVPFKSRKAWQTWLARQHAISNGVWLKLAKQGSGIASVSYQEALEVALCYGWIDGQKAPLDASHWLQRFTPRAARSKWSKRNRLAAAELIKTGAMRAAGLREIERAKADGRWQAAYDSAKTASVPADLQGALDKDPDAAKFFATLESRNRYAILYRLQDAKKPETRARRLGDYVAMLKAKKKFHP